MTRKALLVVVCVTLAMLGIARAGDAQNKKVPAAPALDFLNHFRVRVQAKAEQTDEPLLRQCLFREIRKMPEAIIEDDAKALTDFELHVVMVRLPPVRGYAAAVMVDAPLDTGWLKTLLGAALKDVDEGTKKGALNLVDMYGSGSSTYLGEAVLTDSSLPSLCQRIVAQFETSQVEDWRQNQQKTRDYLNQH